MLPREIFSRRVRVERQTVVPITEFGFEGRNRFLGMLHQVKKSVSDGVASPEGLNTLTAGDATPALARIRIEEGRED